MALNSHTLQDVISFAKRQFGDESGTQIGDDDIIRATNQACMEIVSKNKVLRASASTDSVTGQDEYDKPSDCLQVTSVKYNDQLLRGMGFDQFQEFYNSTSTTDITTWTQYGDKIIIGATPQADITGGIKIYYVPEPAAMVSSSDTLPVPDRYFERICEYVMSKLYELDEDWQGHQVNRQMFEDKLNELNFEETNKSGPFAVIGRFDGYDW